MGSLRSLDRRTVAICVAIAVVGALLAALVTSIAIGDDRGSTATAGEGFDLVPANEIEGDALLSAPAETITGEVTDLGTLFVDQPMLVNFWQSSCAPCVEEMPLFEQMGKDNPDLTVVGVDTLDDLERATELADETGITYPWLQDPTGSVFLAAHGSGMPTTVLLDDQGTVVASRTGAFTDPADLQAFVDENSG